MCCQFCDALRALRLPLLETWPVRAACLQRVSKKLLSIMAAEDDVLELLQRQNRCLEGVQGTAAAAER